MEVIILVLVLVAAGMLFVFLKFPPLFTDQKLVNVFNMMVLGVTALLVVTFFAAVYKNMAGTVNHKFWAPWAIGGSSIIIAGFLFICFLLRNFWVFKPKKNPWQ